MKRLLAFLMALVLLAGGMTAALAADSKVDEWKLAWYENGDAAAANHVGYSYGKGINGVSQNYEEAFKWYGYAASKGNVQGMFNLGLYYDNGWGAAQDYEAAVKWYTAAAEKGNASAQNNLGVCYGAGKGVAKDTDEAIKWYKLAAEQGNKDSQYNLGVRYENGNGVAKNLDEAIKWYKLAAEQGYEDAQEALDRLGVTADSVSSATVTAAPTATPKPASSSSDLGIYNKETRALFEIWGKKDYSKLSRGSKGAAVKKLQNRLIALNYLADGKADGDYGKITANAVHLFKESYFDSGCDCTSRDYCVATPGMQYVLFSGEAKKNYGDPAKSGDPGLYYATFLERINQVIGNVKGSGNASATAAPKNLSQLEKWKQDWNNNGNANSAYSVGYSYYEGENGAALNYAEAVKWFRYAAEKGHAEAQVYLGECYSEGEGVAQNIAEAKKWYAAAAKQGHEYAQEMLDFYDSQENSDPPEVAAWKEQWHNGGYAEAAYNVGLCYIYGYYGVEIDDAKGAQWLSYAANADYPRAQFMLGLMYRDGDGVSVNYAEAARLITAAAQQGDTDAQYVLGGEYLDGKIVTQSYAEAVKWFTRAAEQGHGYAQADLGGLYYNGVGVKQNYAEAAKWFSLAAEQDADAEAVFCLASMYATGKGVAEDQDKALGLIYQAASLGHPEAIRILEEMYGQ